MEALGELSWVVHPLAGLALAFYASVIFSPRGREWRLVAVCVVLVGLLAVLGADWIVHPASGMLLGFFGSRAFHKWRRSWPSLLVGLVGALFFMTLGASWLIFPLMVMGMIWLFTAAFQATAGTRRPGALESGAVTALPEAAEGLPLGTFGGKGKERELVPVGARPTQAKTQQAPLQEPAPLATFVRDERLPGEARAQLAALDLRVREALTHLKAVGQEGGETAYLARAIRDEYAPTAVQGYLKLPPTLANTQPLEDGKTGRDLLREQLDILLDAVQDILGTALRSGGQELLTHQRFLREKFRKPRGDLDV
ncbi:hypothetical protein V3W47_06035 [Deinococcus sp. YIM 134068]|uniref:hypothetical protein n=1 Tax=Deinococcus lichenicola TaxID=3118910 RepID=UPI002F91DC9A